MPLWDRAPTAQKSCIFFQIRPLASVVHALQQPVELEITVDIHEPVNEELDKGALRQTGAGQALFNRLLKSSL